MKKLLITIVFIILSSNLLISQRIKDYNKDLISNNKFTNPHQTQENGFVDSDYKWREAKVNLIDDRYKFAFLQNVWIYDEGKLVEELERDQNNIPRQLFNYLYNTNGSVAEKITSRWNYETGKLALFNKQINIYNTEQKIIEKRTQYVRNNVWVDYDRNIFVYENGLLKEEIRQIYHSNEWSNNSKFIYLYRKSNKIQSIYIRNNYQTQTFSDSISKSTFEYDVNGNNTKTIYYSYSSSSWENNSLYLKKYNSSNLIIKDESKKWDKNINKWIFDKYSRNITYEYDSLGELSLSKSKLFDVDSAEWKDWYETSYKNGNDNKLVLVLPTNSIEVKANSSFWISWIGVGIENVNIDFSNDNGTSYTNISNNILFKSKFEWKTPNKKLQNCKIKISDSSNPIVSNEVENSFRIVFIRSDRKGLVHETSSIKTTVTKSGYFEGFRFNDSRDPLSSGGGFIFGIPRTGINGMMTSLSISDMKNYEELVGLNSDNSFNQKTYCSFTDSSASTPLGIIVQQRTYSNNNDDYIYYNYSLYNTYDSLYVGIFADWDVGGYSGSSSNMCGIDSERNLVYQYDGGTNIIDSNYYGIIALNGISGAAVTNRNRNARELAFNFISGKSNFVEQLNDLRSFIGSGPFDKNTNINVTFAIVAGIDFANLKENADLAIAGWKDGIVSVEKEKLKVPKRIILLQNYPNPFNPTTVIKYQIPNIKNQINSNLQNSNIISLKVYDILGKEVATLVNKEQQAGNYKVTFDASNLPSGVYYYRITSGNFTETKQMLLVK